MEQEKLEYQFFSTNKKKLLTTLSPQILEKALDEMLRIRSFEVRAESAYQQGKIGGFFHAYIGQEAIQTACVLAMGEKNWWVTTYRCHALALLLGATPLSIMQELFGRKEGNALGRGGSMHLYTDRLLGGFGIVGGQVPIATGAGFSLKYLGNTEEIAVCFLGDGAVPQGAFHEALNLASLWDLPCLFVIENNQWGMGTHFQRANAVNYLAKEIAPSYRMEGWTFDGMDFLHCFEGFKSAKEKILKEQRPLLVEVITERFRGHSISDPGLYRSKEQLQQSTQRDPLVVFRKHLEEVNLFDEEAYKSREAALRKEMMAIIKEADNSPWPDPQTLEQDVFAP